MDEFVQTRVPSHYAKALAEQARLEGISTAAHLRRLIMQSVDSRAESVVDAWVLPATAVPLGGRGAALPDHPHLKLAVVGQATPATERVFGVAMDFDGSWRRVTSSALRANGTSWFQDPPGYRFVLAGGSTWEILYAMDVDRGAGSRIEVTLRLTHP